MIFPLISLAYESKYFVCCWKLWITQKNLGNSQRVVRMFFVVLVPFFFFSCLFCFSLFRKVEFEIADVSATCFLEIFPTFGDYLKPGSTSFQFSCVCSFHASVLHKSLNSRSHEIVKRIETRLSRKL